MARFNEVMRRTIIGCSMVRHIVVVQRAEPSALRSFLAVLVSVVLVSHPGAAQVVSGPWIDMRFAAGWQFNAPPNGLVDKSWGSLLRSGGFMGERLRLGGELFLLGDGGSTETSGLGLVQIFPIRRVPVYVKGALGLAWLTDDIDPIGDTRTHRFTPVAAWGGGAELGRGLLRITLGVDWIYQNRQSVAIASGHRLTTVASFGLVFVPGSQ